MEVGLRPLCQAYRSKALSFVEKKLRSSVRVLVFAWGTKGLVLFVIS